jgi:hypothetical protein
MRTINTIGGVLSCMGISVMLFALFSPDTPTPIATAVVAAEPSAAAKAAADKRDAIQAEKARKKAESDARAAEGKAEYARRKQVVDTLPNKTPDGVPVEKDTFFGRYLIGITKDPIEEMKLADNAIAIARLDGLRCDSVSGLSSWSFSVGLTLECNKGHYKYYIEDKGRGYQARIAD